MEPVSWIQDGYRCKTWIWLFHCGEHFQVVFTCPNCLCADNGTKFLHLLGVYRARCSESKYLVNKILSWQLLSTINAPINPYIRVNATIDFDSNRISLHFAGTLPAQYKLCTWTELWWRTKDLAMMYHNCQKTDLRCKLYRLWWMRMRHRELQPTLLWL